MSGAHLAALLGRLVVPIAFIAFAVLFIINIKDFDFRATVFPFFAITFILTLSVIVIASEVYRYLRGESAATPDPNRWREWRQTYARPIGCIVFLMLYIYAIPRTGFFPATLAFLVAMCLMIGVSWRKLPIAVGIMILVTVSAHVFFSTVLQIQLP